MIDLQIESYCNNCPDFEVEQETMSFGISDNYHKLECKHRYKCKSLANYLKRELPNE